MNHLIAKEEVLRKAYQELDSFYWTEEEIRAYEREQKNKWDYEAEVRYNLRIGREEGRQEGLAEAVLNMHKAEMSIETISHILPLTKKEVATIIKPQA